MWQKLQPREKILLAILGACVVLFALFYFLLIPQYDTFVTNREALLELENKARAAEELLSSEKAEKELAYRAAEKLNEVKPLFNNRMTDGLAVAHIGFEAMRTSVRIDSIIPSDIIDKGTHMELPVKFKVSGDYPDVVSFINKMEGLPNLSDLRSLTIQPEKAVVATAEDAVEEFTRTQAPSAPGSDQSGRVTAEFELVIYSSVTAEERLKLEQAAGWQLGRQNAFRTPGYRSPFPDKETITEAPVQANDNKSDVLNTLIKQIFGQGIFEGNNSLPGSSGVLSDNNRQERQ